MNPYLHRVTPPPNTGYSFSYWKDSNNNKITFPYTVSEDITLTAVFSYVGVSTTLSGSVNLQLANQRVSYIADYVYQMTGNLPSASVTFSKTFLSTPSVSVSLSYVDYETAMWVTKPSNVSVASRTTKGFTTSSTGTSTAAYQFMEGNSSVPYVKLNWTATGKV